MGSRILPSLAGWACGVLLALELASNAAVLPKVRDVAVPVFLEGESSPAAIVRIGHGFRDYQRKGFFRIGLLPLLIAEDVEVSFRHGGSVSNALAKIQARLERQFQQHAFELRRVRFTFPGEAQPRLRAARVRVVSVGRWQLDEVILMRSAGAVHLPSASLTVAGPAAGLLRWRQATGDDSSNLFAPDLSPHR